MSGLNVTEKQILWWYPLLQIKYVPFCFFSTMSPCSSFARAIHSTLLYGSFSVLALRSHTSILSYHYKYWKTRRIQIVSYWCGDMPPETLGWALFLKVQTAYIPLRHLSQITWTKSTLPKHPGCPFLSYKPITCLMSSSIFGIVICSLDARMLQVVKWSRKKVLCVFITNTCQLFDQVKGASCCNKPQWAKE